MISSSHIFVKFYVTEFYTNEEDEADSGELFREKLDKVDTRYVYIQTHCSILTVWLHWLFVLLCCSMAGLLHETPAEIGWIEASDLAQMWRTSAFTVVSGARRILSPTGVAHCCTLLLALDIFF